MIASEGVDFSGGVAELLKYILGVLSQGRNWIEARGTIGQPKRAPHDGHSPYRRLHLSDHLPRNRLRMSENLANAVQLPVR